MVHLLEPHMNTWTAYWSSKTYAIIHTFYILFYFLLKILLSYKMTSYSSDSLSPKLQATEDPG